VYDPSCSTRLTALTPSVNSYPGFTQPIGTPDVWTRFSEDVYLRISGGSATSVTVDVFVFPYQWLLWFGGFVIVAGGALAFRRKPPSESDASNLATPDVGRTDA
jgi:cytochrome c biogenesis factor